MLERRAIALKKGQFSKAEKIQNEMVDFKNKHLDELITPTLFFCTFVHEDAYNEALERK